MGKAIRENPCKECHKPHWFRYWTADQCDSSIEGLGVGDFDLMVHRFRDSQDNSGVRNNEHIMVVEVKIADEKLGAAQRDSLSCFNGALNAIVPISGEPIGVSSRPGMIQKGKKKIVWHGVHLLRVPLAKSTFGPFVWDNNPIVFGDLVAVFNFVNDPRRPMERLDIDRRHKRRPHAPLWSDVTA